MTALTPDLPDWTKQDSAGTVFLDGGPIAVGATKTVGLIGVASYIIYAQPAVGANVQLGLKYELSPTIALPLLFAFLTALSAPANNAFLTYESPSYGGVLLVQNGDPSNAIDIFVMSSQRPVTTPRILGDISPGRTFQNGGGGWTMNTPLHLTPIDGVLGGYAANVNTGFTALASGDGLLEFWYLSATFSVEHIPVMDLLAGITQQVELPLPQCIGQFYFTPAATDPAGTITALAYPARS